MKVKKSPLNGLLVIEPTIFSDQRGYFFESYSKSKFAEMGINIDFLQDNQSFSHKGVIRALHAQAAPYPQTKLVRVIKGKILDVAVDIRKESATYGKFESFELSAENQLQVLVPHGFLHGFSVLEEDSVVAFKIDNYYSQENVVGIKWNDPTLAIDWQVPEDQMLISDSDKELPLFKDLISPF